MSSSSDPAHGATARSGRASSINRQIAFDVVDAMVRGATLSRGLELMRDEIGGVRAAGDAMFEVTVGLRRLLDPQFSNASTDWWLEVLEGCNIGGLTRRGLISLLDSVCLAARRDGPLVGLDRVGRPPIAALTQIATVHAVLYSLQRHGQDAGGAGVPI